MWAVGSRFKLWGFLETVPTARITVPGIDPVSLVEAASRTLTSLKFGAKYRDAKVQWDRVLQGRNSPWTVRILERGSGLRPHWSDLIPRDFAADIPGVREHVGEQTVLLAAQSIGLAMSDFVISAEQSASGVNSQIFAVKALESISRDLEARGIHFEHVAAVRPKDLEEACPAHQITRIMLQREAKKLQRETKKAWRRRSDA